MTNNNKLLPGILCDGIEFFVHADGIKFLSSGKVSDFTDLSFSYLQMLKECIDNDKEVKAELLNLHPNSEFKRLEKFTKCRFGGLDYVADIDKSGLQKGEYWNCPIRGKCSSEGILCKAVSYNGNELDAIDISMTKKLATNATNEVIAAEMNLPMGSFHLQKKKLYKKFGIQTKQESTIIAQRLNII